MKLFLIDGHALIFKMYYAFLGRPMVNSKGVDTSILFGFTKYVLELIQRENPTHLAVFFDPPGGTFRNKLYPEYKANRGETPQLVIDALEPLTKICKALQIPVLMVPGYEADDVIGAMARKSAAQGFDVYMVTPDKDYGQLVSSHIFQYRPGKSGSDNEILGIEEICLKWGIDRPGQVIDILAICGDTSDNVPGVQGVGPVGASKLLKKYGTLESIYEHLDELSARQQEMFAAARDHIALSKTLVTIKTDIELDVTAEQMAISVQMTPELNSVFQEYEFPSLMRMLPKLATSVSNAPAARQNKVSIEYEEVSDPASLGIKTSVAVNLKGDNVCLATPGKTLTLPFKDAKAVLEDERTAKTGYDLKSQMNILSVNGIELRGKLWDIQLMHYLVNPERSHQLESLSLSYLGQELVSEDNHQESLSLFDDDDCSDTAASNLSRETQIVLLIGEILRNELQNSDLQKLYDEIEEPLIGVLSRMETNGVRIDLDSLKEFADNLRESTASLEGQIREMAGEPELNVSSPKQIGQVIFEKLKLDPKAKKPSNKSWPTDESTLLELADRHPIIDAILEYRGAKKLLNTYIEPFPQYVSSRDGRVHTTFNQALTSTGRLSSSNPNLQNIPIRTDQGKEIRAAFVAPDNDSVIMSADYSQIELRLMAHLCGDANMIEAFRAGTDVHSVTASRIFKVDLDSVTPGQRRVAKTANFGIMYGISAFGLAQRLRCSRSEAKSIIDDYFSSFPAIREFIDNTILFARKNGYVQTLFGRRRYVPDVNAQNAQIRSLAERNAVNAPIQGTAADIIKIAMARVDERVRRENLKSRMVLQIHDELVLEVPVAEIERVREILVSEMEGVIKLNVPLTVECNYGKNWLQAH